MLKQVMKSFCVFCLLGETSNDSYIIASGLQPSWNNRQLPVGLEGDGFSLTCSVMVFDDLGASETYFVQHVTVWLRNYVIMLL